MHGLRDFAAREHGASVVEYALALVLVVTVAAVAMPNFGATVQDEMTEATGAAAALPKISVAAGESQPGNGNTDTGPTNPGTGTVTPPEPQPEPCNGNSCNAPGQKK